MTMMKKRTALAVAAAIWIAASSSATALLYELNRPLHEVGMAGRGMTPVASILLAGGWLAVICVVYGWGWKVANEPELVYARATRHP
jgi:hypothetical protein